MTSGNLLVSLLAPEVPNNPDTNKIAFMPLTDTFIKALKPDPSASAGTKYSDGHGLYLHAKESGKYWRMAYRFGGEQKTLALGTYPTIGLAQARRKRDEAREQLASNIDPEADRTTVAEIAKKHKVSDATIYAWRKHFGQTEAGGLAEHRPEFPGSTFLRSRRDC